jgi:hypothetical protein
MLGQCSACAADRPTSARFEPARRFRGFHHWFTRRCTVLPCLPDPARLAVPDRPVVVGAAPTLPAASQVRLPPASTGLLRQPSGGSFHPTRSHGASWRTPLSPWSLAGRLRGRPGRPCGPLIGGTASTTASTSMESWVLAAESATARGMPRRSTSRWYLDPGLPRSVGFGPVSVPLVWRARSASPRWPGTSRAGPGGQAHPAAGGAGAATPPPARCQSPIMPMSRASGKNRPKVGNTL